MTPVLRIGSRALACVAALLALAAPAPGQQLPEELAARDENGDGRLQRSEAPIDLLSRFEAIDTNGDGVIDGFEMADFERARLEAEEEPPEASPDAPPQPSAATDAATDAAEEPRRVQTVEELVRAMDRDGDGRLTLDEVPLSLQETILRMDLDSDGVLDLDEARRADQGRAQAGSGGGGPGHRTLTRTVHLMDTDGDGRLQKKEAPLALQRVFSRFDRNGDGAIDASEAAAVDAEVARRAAEQQGR